MQCESRGSCPAAGVEVAESHSGKRNLECYCLYSRDIVRRFSDCAAERRAMCDASKQKQAKTFDLCQRSNSSLLLEPTNMQKTSQPNVTDDGLQLGFSPVTHIKVGRASSHSPVASQTGRLKRRTGECLFLNRMCCGRLLAGRGASFFSFCKGKPCNKRKGKVFASKSLGRCFSLPPGKLDDRARDLMQCNEDADLAADFGM